MRFLFGIIVGALLTIGVAYLHDTATAGSLNGPAGVEARMVNWDVVNRNVAALSQGVRQDWDRLTERFRHAG
jgi:hypothetical protein